MRATSDPAPRARASARSLPSLERPLAVLLALSAFAILAEGYVTGDPLVYLDERVASSLHAHLILAVTAAAKAVTLLGGVAVLGALTCLAAGYLFGRGRRRDAVLVVLAMVGAQALTAVCKGLFQRERPSFDDPVATATYFSFPSGHAFSSIAVYGALLCVLAPHLRSTAERAACLAATTLLVTAIGFTRLYLGVHYLSDVLAGWSLGLAWLLVLVAAVRARWRLPRAPRLAPRFSMFAIAIVPLLVLAVACGGGDGSGARAGSAPRLPHGSEPVSLEPRDFVGRIDNPYWPMVRGSKWVYREIDGDGNVQRVDVTVTGRTKRIGGIAATVVHDVVTEDGELKEETFDWYAQDRWGNVWYLGEQTKEYDDGGRVVSTEGSWQAGVDGAHAGMVMPARPKVGMAYRHVYYAGQAEEVASILTVEQRARVPYGLFGHLVVTRNFSPLEPDVLGHKFYAPGVGLILGVDVAGQTEREELVSFRPPPGTPY